MKRRMYILAICYLLSVFLVGCALNKSSTKEDLQRLSRIEIYTSDGDLVNTIEDENILYQFNSLDYNDTSFETDSEQDELKNTVESLPVLYTIISYKTPVSVYNDGTLEKEMEITVYENSNIIKEQISSDTIKGDSIPEEYLTFYITVSEEDKDFILSLGGPNNQ